MTIRASIALVLSILSIFATAAEAQSPTMPFEQAVFVTCREAQAMTPDARRALALFLAEYSTRRYGVVIPDDNRGAQLAFLVRGGCTISPDAYLFAVIDKAVLAERANLPRR